MTPTQHLIIAFLAGALLATVATLYAKRALLRSNANLRDKLMTVNAANDALRTEQARMWKAYRAIKQTNITLRRSLGQYKRDRRVER